MAVLSVQVQASLQTQCEALASKVWTKHKTTKSTDRMLIGVAGIPGVGKSTITDLVVTALNNLQTVKTGIPTTTFAITVPMDGFHYTRSHLCSMPDPETAIHRRGAAFTYDSDAYLAFIQSLAWSDPSATLYAPSFSHTLKDPVENDIPVFPESRIILIEGNYCALNREPWLSAASLMNELWFIDADIETVRHRLARRHVESAICGNLEEAYERIRTTDFLNAQDIVENTLEVQEIIKL